MTSLAHQPTLWYTGGWIKHPRLVRCLRLDGPVPAERRVP